MTELGVFRRRSEERLRQLKDGALLSRQSRPFLVALEDQAAWIKMIEIRTHQTFSHVRMPFQRLLAGACRGIPDPNSAVTAPGGDSRRLLVEDHGNDLTPAKLRRLTKKIAKITLSLYVATIHDHSWIDLLEILLSYFRSPILI